MKRELLYSFTKKDFRVDTFRAGGKGGQNQNKRDSGVRITHIESGLSSESREHRDQLTNKKAAFEKLVPKLVKLYSKKTNNFTHAPDKTVRTYHEPDDRITDEFGNLFSYKEVIDKGKKNKISEMIDKHTVGALHE